MSENFWPGRFAGRRVLVTGGTQNIGLAIARRFAREGATVIVNGLHAADADAASASLRAEGLAAVGIGADVSSPDEVAEMFSRIDREFGGLDVLVNNAALPMVGRVPFKDLTLDEWDRSFAVNARGTYLCSAAAVTRMSAGSSIVGISSIGATKAHRSAVAYDATKGAIEALTRALALELAPDGIRVNAVAPGAVSNDRYEALSPDVQRTEATPIPLGRVGIGSDVAAGVSFLASDEAAYITGHILTIDGGLTAQARQQSSEIDIPDPRNA